MIHDFATLSKCNPPEELRPPCKEAATTIPLLRPGKHRQYKRAFMAVSMITAIGVLAYSRVWSGDSVAMDFSPGQLEAREYQMESLMLTEGTLEQGTAYDNVLSRFEITEATNALTLETPLTDNETQEQAAFEAALNHEPVAETGFGFYDSLQASTWDIPVQKGVYLTEEDIERATFTYMLQAASMRSHGDALALVRKLKEMGMNATYTKSSGSYGDTWYRVNVGPFSDVSIMNKAEDRLVAMRMMPLKRRIR